MPLTHIEQHYFLNSTVIFIIKIVLGDIVNYTNISHVSRTMNKIFSPPRAMNSCALSLVLVLTGVRIVQLIVSPLRVNY